MSIVRGFLLCVMLIATFAGLSNVAIYSAFLLLLFSATTIVRALRKWSEG